jgi:hypothetical protein
MKLRAKSLFLAAMISCTYQPAIAAPILTLSSMASPMAVGIGQPITVRLELTGLVAGEQLDSLAATVAYDGTLLGTPTVTAGPIVPNPLDDPLDLLISTDTGLADVAFLTFGIDAADHITSNGTFFTFQAAALAPGSANIALDFVGATLFNAANPNDPTILTVQAGEPISFVVVPEPSHVAILSAIAFGLAVCRCHRRNRPRG